MTGGHKLISGEKTIQGQKGKKHHDVGGGGVDGWPLLQPHLKPSDSWWA